MMMMMILSKYFDVLLGLRPSWADLGQYFILSPLKYLCCLGDLIMFLEFGMRLAPGV